MGRDRGAAEEDAESVEEEACGPVSWAAFARHWLKWLVYMMAFSLVIVPADRYLECRLGKGLVADVLFVAFGTLLLLAIVWVDRALARRGR